MSTERRGWSPEELLIAFRLYCRMPFGRLHQRNPEIIALAELLNRTPDAVAMKACNFASLDSRQRSRGIKALKNVSKADKALWEAFLEDSQAVAQRAEEAYAFLTGKEEMDYIPELGRSEEDSSKERANNKRKPINMQKQPEGATEKEVLLTVRRVQSFFRAAVLTSYDNRCALTGLAIPELLNASHIIPWSVDEKRRADPRNGICLNALHDRAFDRGLISFDENLRVIVSTTINNAKDCDLHRSHLVALSGCPLRLPERFQPESAAVEYHRIHVYCP